MAMDNNVVVGIAHSSTWKMRGDVIIDAFKGKMPHHIGLHVTGFKTRNHLPRKIRALGMVLEQKMIVMQFGRVLVTVIIRDLRIGFQKRRKKSVSQSLQRDVVWTS